MAVTDEKTAFDESRTPLLEVDDIHTYYGAIEALKGISITVFNQQQLLQRNIVNSSDLATYTPSLSAKYRTCLTFVLRTTWSEPVSSGRPSAPSSVYVALMTPKMLASTP